MPLASTYPKAGASREVFWSRYPLSVISSFSLKHWKSDWIYTSMKTFFLFHQKIMTVKISGVFPDQMVCYIISYLQKFLQNPRALTHLYERFIPVEIFLKKVIPFESLPFSPFFTETIEIFLYHLFG